MGLRKFSQQFRVPREAAPTPLRLSKWSQLEPLQPFSEPSQPPPSSSGTSLLSRASSAVQPLRAVPPKASTSKWSPRGNPKSLDTKFLNRSLERSRPATASGPERSTPSTSANILSRTTPRTLPGRHSNFLRDAAPHSSVQATEKPSPIVSDPRAHQAQQPPILRSHPDPDVSVDIVHHANAVSEFTKKDILPSTHLGDKGRLKRPGRNGEFKERGSLLHSPRTSVPSAKQKTWNRWQQLELKKDRARYNKKVKDTRPQNVRADLYIPTVVTVGQFARLLNVRLGAFFLQYPYLTPYAQFTLGTLQRKMVQAGMRDEIPYDYGSFSHSKGKLVT